MVGSVSPRYLCSDDRLVDGGVQPLDVGEFLLGDPRDAVAMLDDGDLAAAGGLLRLSASTMLVRAWSVQSARGSTMPPVVSEPTVTSGRSTSSL